VLGPGVGDEFTTCSVEARGLCCERSALVLPTLGYGKAFARVVSVVTAHVRRFHANLWSSQYVVPHELF